jgi:Fe-S oxidoreductase
MNPGKICTPIDSDEQLVSVDAQKRGYFDRQIPVNVKESFSSALDCNGNGLCFNYDADSPMCPSSKVTRDRRQSPKGRAGLMREWLRLLENKGVDVLALEENIQGWSVKNLIDKVKNTLKSNRDEDFSHEVMEAMQGCLACKACASQCPIKVDVPDFRSRFINLYHTRYTRPLKDHLVANVETLVPLMSKMPNVVNSVLSNRVYEAISRKTIGYQDTPLLSVPTLIQLAAQESYQGFDLAHFQRLSSEARSQFVFIVQDPFTSYYEAQTVADFMKLVQLLGLSPVLLPFKPNGKAQHVKGFLSKFAKTAKSTAEFLNSLHDLGIPMVGIEASLVLCYRDEYKQTLKDQRGDFNVMLSHEWLFANLEQFNYPEQQLNTAPFKLFAHCTEKTALAKSEQQWCDIFDKFGLQLDKIPTGCCGMAGTYGHEVSNFENSKSLYEMSWQPQLDNCDRSQILATGFSCRSQVKRFDKFKPKHPVTALLSLFN